MSAEPGPANSRFGDFLRSIAERADKQEFDGGALIFVGGLSFFVPQAREIGVDPRYVASCLDNMMHKAVHYMDVTHCGHIE